MKDLNCSAVLPYFLPPPPLNPQLSSPFFRLFPAEVRLLIYEFIFVGHGVHLKPLAGPNSAIRTVLCFPCYRFESATKGYVAACETGCHHQWTSALGRRFGGSFDLLWTCKLIYHEALAIIQAHSFACFTTVPDPWSTPSIPTHIPLQFQNLAVHWRISADWWDGDDFRPPYWELQKWLGSGRSIKNLRLTFSLVDRPDWMTPTSQERFFAWLVPVLGMGCLERVFVNGWSGDWVRLRDKVKEFGLEKMRFDASYDLDSGSSWAHGNSYGDENNYDLQYYYWSNHQEFYGADDDEELTSSESSSDAWDDIEGDEGNDSI